MKPKTHFKYIEWRDTPGLHEDVVQSISELKFLRDELHFLRDLVSEHTFELIYGKPYEEAAQIGAQLLIYENRVQYLLKKLNMHSNNLQTLMDTIEVPHELKDYKDAHYKLMISIMDFHSDVKKTKRVLFEMLALIKKGNKQKKLL